MHEGDTISPRLRISQSESTLCIRIARGSGLGASLVKTVVLTGFIGANMFLFGVLLPEALSRPIWSWDTVILIVFALAFSGMSIYLGGTIVFEVAGSQEILASDKEWTLKTRVLVARVRRFDVSRIRSLRIDSKIYPRKKGVGWALVRRIAFDYESRAVRTFGNLTEAEANHILRLLSARLPSQ